MKQTPKQFFATPAGKLTLAVIAMVLCWTVLIVYLSKTSAGGTWFPTDAHFNNVRSEIRKETSTLNAETEKLNTFEDLQDTYETALTTYWNADRDGQPETELRNLINDAAAAAKANIQTLGSVRTSTINNELSYADLDFTVVDEYDKVIRFFAEVEKCTPRLSWRRVELRVEPTRARNVTGPNARQNNAAAATTTPPAQMFRTTGQVRVIKYSPAGNAASKTTTATAAKTTPAAKTTTPAATTPAATTPATGTNTPAATTPAANTKPATDQPAAASAAATPAQQGPAANPTTNKEN